MPDDLLRFVSGPPGYSPWWLALGLALLLIVISWYTIVFVATLPSERLRRMRGIGDLHARVLRHRYARTAAAVGRRYDAGELTEQQAGAELNRTLRSFLHQATGRPAQYMHVRTITETELRSAAPLLNALDTARFDRASMPDLTRLSRETEEMIRSWR